MTPTALAVVGFAVMAGSLSIFLLARHRKHDTVEALGLALLPVVWFAAALALHWFSPNNP